MYIWGFVILALLLLIMSGYAFASVLIDPPAAPLSNTHPAGNTHNPYQNHNHNHNHVAPRPKQQQRVRSLSDSCEKYSNTSCGACTTARVIGGCDWCPSTGECVKKTQVWTSCPNTWVREQADCWITELVPNCAASGTGCTDPQSVNYDFRAVNFDDSCVFQKRSGPTDNSTCSRKCACSNGGLLREYGKFCSLHYTGCPGEQPCDALDLCCQMHDWCVTVEAYPDCECGNMLHRCVTGLTEQDYAASACPDQMKRTAENIAAETYVQVQVECGGKDYYSKCGPAINCNGVGTCRFDGGCDCGSTNSANQYFAYDRFGRTNCKCKVGYYPQCNASADELCTTYCDSFYTCNNVGLCDKHGRCQCISPYTGEGCEIVKPGFSSIYYLATPSTIKTLCVVGACVIGIACIATITGVIVVVAHRTIHWRRLRYNTPPSPSSSPSHAQVLLL